MGEKPAIFEGFRLLFDLIKKSTLKARTKLIITSVSIILIIILMFLPGLSSIIPLFKKAKSLSVKGVVCSVEKKPISDCYVILEYNGNKEFTKTDSTGEFIFDDLYLDKPYSLELKIEKPGYEKYFKYFKTEKKFVCFIAIYLIQEGKK